MIFKRKINDLPKQEIMVIAYQIVIILWLARPDVFSPSGKVPYFLLYLLGDPLLVFAAGFILLSLIPTMIIFRRRRWLSKIIDAVLAFMLYTTLTFVTANQNFLMIFDTHAGTSYEGHYYYLTSTTDIFTYTQYTVYECDELGIMCRRVSDPLRTDGLTIVTCCFCDEPPLPPRPESFRFVTKSDLHDHLYVEIDGTAYEVPTQ